MSKRIGILTSGGDCAGLNAAIDAVAIAAGEKGWETIGIHNGTAGLLSDQLHHEVLPKEGLGEVTIRQGGTILGTTNKGDPFAYPMPDGTKKDRTDEIIENARKLDIEALIGIGGDGSLAILSRIADKGEMPYVWIPKTIDNDVGATELAIGFDTAVMKATQALDDLQSTAASHDRVMILEVMGRDAGHIALESGIAGGADVILIPEIPYKIESVVRKIKELNATGMNYARIVISEAAQTLDGGKAMVDHGNNQKRYGGIGDYLKSLLEKEIDADVRVQVLGHIQRGGSPTWNDRKLAKQFGVQAVELIAQGKYRRMVALKDGKITDVPVEEAIDFCRVVNPDDTLVKVARALGICLGDE